MDNFYNKYVDLCNKAKIAPTAASVAMGFSKVAPNGWKKGREPRDATLQKICDYFGVTVDYFIDETEKAPAPKSEGVNIDAALEAMTDEQLIQFIRKASELLAK